MRTEKEIKEAIGHVSDSVNACANTAPIDLGALEMLIAVREALKWTIGEQNCFGPTIIDRARARERAERQ